MVVIQYANFDTLDSVECDGSRRQSGESGFDSSSVASFSSDGEESSVKKPIVKSCKFGDMKSCQLSAVSEKSSPEDGDGGVYAKELIDVFGVNLHRIERDVNRCDRNHPFFHRANLDRLQNVLCSYVWKHLHVGYVQGMCDLAAPLLVILEDEAITYYCFELLMKRMCNYFVQNTDMDAKLSNIRLLLQVIDNELFENMKRMDDHTHFYFCYRWFLLDFKREFKYKDVYLIWESIWAASHLDLRHFDLFSALSLIETYRDVLVDTCSDFSDVIKFFNESAEKHDAKSILETAREILYKLQLTIR